MSAASGEVIVGRDHEIAAVRGALAALRRGESTTLELVGEAGIGKSSLLRIAERVAAPTGVTVLRGRASELEQDVPYGLWLDVLSGLAPDIDSSTPQLRHLLHRRFRERLATSSGERGLVLTLDDLHWADAASIDLVRSIIDRGIDAPLLLILSHRPHHQGSAMPSEAFQHGPLGKPQRFVLAPLTEPDLARILPRDFTSSERRRLAQQSGGNPIYLQALATRLLRERAADGSRDAGQPGRPLGLQSASPVAKVALATEAVISAALASEIQPLSSEARALLNAAAVAGDPFDVGLASVIAGRPDQGLDVLDELVAADLVRPAASPHVFMFRHPLLHAAVYASTPVGWRISAHAEAVRALLARGVDPATIAPHVERSAKPGDHVSIELLKQAGESARGRAPAASAHWFGAAWALTQDAARTDPANVPLLMNAWVAFMAAGEVESARDVLLHVQGRLKQSDPARAGLTHGIAIAEAAMDRSERARFRLEAAVAELPRGASHLRALFLIDLAWLDFDQDRRDDLVAHAGQALQCAEVLDDPHMLAATRALRALASAIAEPDHEATVRLDDATSTLQALPTSGSADIVPALLWAAQAAALLQQYEVALGLFQRAVVASSDGVMPILAVHAMAGCAIWQASSGDVRAGWRGAEAALEEARLMTNSSGLFSAQAAMSVLHELAGDPHQAVAAAQQALAHADRTGVKVMRTAFGAVLGRALLAAGQAEAASEAILHSHGGPEFPLIPARLQAISYGVLTTAAIRAAVAVGVGSAPSSAAPGSAESWLEQASGWARRAESAADADGLPTSRFAALLAAAEYALAVGDGTQASVFSSRAAHAAEAGRDTIGAGRALMVRSHAEVAAGDRFAAGDTLRAAEALFAGAGADRLAGEAVRALRAIGRRVNQQGRGTVAGPARVQALTPRQREIAELAAAGFTNGEIADQLVLSPRTVETHLTAAFVKLGVAARTALPTVLGTGAPSGLSAESNGPDPVDAGARDGV